MADTDDDAFTCWVQEKWNRLFRTAYVLVGDRGHAEDLVQAALLKVHRRWHKLDQPDAYTRRVLLNLVRSRWRLRSSHEYPTEWVPDTQAPDAIAIADHRDELWRRLHRLPSKMRAVLFLRYFEDLPEAEIAEMLGCSLGTVKSQLSRGLGRLRNSYTTADIAESSAAGGKASS